MDANEIRYTPINGLPEMREAARIKFKRDNNLDYGMDQIAVGSGTKQILFNCLMATVSAGDETIIPAPYWASYPDMAIGRHARHRRLRPEQPFQNAPGTTQRSDYAQYQVVDVQLAQQSDGATYSLDELKALADVLLANPHVYILTDDVYEHLIYDGRTFHTLAEVEPALYDRTVTCNGVSKAYSMTGWRSVLPAGRKMSSPTCRRCSRRARRALPP